MKYSRQQIQEMAQRVIGVSGHPTEGHKFDALVSQLAARFNLSRYSVAQRINLLAMGIGF